MFESGIWDAGSSGLRATHFWTNSNHKSGFFVANHNQYRTNKLKFSQTLNKSTFIVRNSKRHDCCPDTTYWLTTSSHPKLHTQNTSDHKQSHEQTSDKQANRETNKRTDNILAHDWGWSTARQ